MQTNVGKEVAALQRMTIKQLRARYAEVFGDETVANNKAWLVKHIGWRLQAVAEGGLSQRARARAVELARRGWRTKQWTTRKGSEHGGKTFTKTSLHKLLTNLAYVGKVRHKQEVHEGEHTGIVPPDVWQRMQTLLQRNARAGGALVRNSFGAILKGLLRCVPCGTAMTPTRCGARAPREGGIPLPSSRGARAPLRIAAKQLPTTTAHTP